MTLGKTGVSPIDGLGIAAEHYKGAAHEQLAAHWFMSRGMQVYWPACQQGNVDFVVQQFDSFKRVQVKTATWCRAGNYSYLQCRTRLTGKYTSGLPADFYELFVILYPESNSLWCIPAELIKSSNLSLRGSHPTYTTSPWETFVFPILDIKETPSCGQS